MRFCFVTLFICLSGCSEKPAVTNQTPSSQPQPVQASTKENQSTQSQKPMQNRIGKESLEAMFANIRKQSKWNLDGDMLWGYFFTNAKPDALEKAAEQLKSQGYTFVKIYQAEDEGKLLPYYWLHVEKVETHSVDSLHQRNMELYDFADKLKLKSYDGMDVGPVTKSSDGP